MMYKAKLASYVNVFVTFSNYFDYFSAAMSVEFLAKI